MRYRRHLEMGAGYALFDTKDPLDWNSWLERLGEAHAWAWRDDLPEQDRAWGAARREEFGPYIEKKAAPSWPMLLAAVKRAYLAFREAADREWGHPERTTADREARLARTYLWQTLNAHDVAQTTHGPEALRAFQRGFRLGRRKRSVSMKNIPPIVNPPWLWLSLAAKDLNLPGPAAARERALLAAWGQKDVIQASRELYASAWREDIPEEDREWAETYRRYCAEWINDDRRRLAAESAYKAYLQSSDGILGGQPVALPGNRTHYDSEPWKYVAERIEDAPDGESELETAEAAAREYWDARWQEAPPWDTDPDKPHWIAAVRAARKTLADLAHHVPQRR